MNDRCVRLWFAALALAGVLVPAGQPARAEAPEASLTLAWQAAAPELTRAGAGWQVSVPGFAATEIPGQPRLP
ncbi:MAG: hypothetical protein JNK29_15680, partial [Anaerolineales bacterium]|nr:hypothetical protein [Anaerolineales bacterium]